ncbi:S-adenosyl-L-methionine-dependent methyltransferase [Boeremia exigua]|uniref:S-adenosyl-L-methionine-dependent methyltransferase n=1 Tax=Boeremia exigua TaxID=749465 RepID=UPI001E8D3715|nr:S-adenosyl-L-methionine-dependent methyltransferase [Boeremia exigua]KAH6618739.1 S-adenosyl-L-methionine-dependent methyltransferase [Boeremia exigua]
MSIAEMNAKYFDTISDSYDEKPWFAVVNRQVADEFRSNLDWIGIPLANTGSSPASEVRFLDYACGTGLMTRTLGPYVTKTLGIDVSPNMVASYKSRAASAGLPPSTVDAVVGNLFDKEDLQPAHLAGEEWWGFDLAAVGFGFHHFEDVVHAARQLKERLRPGGVLVINDFLEGADMRAGPNGEKIEGSEGNHAVHHHGHGKHAHGEHAHGHGKHEHSHDHAHHEGKGAEFPDWSAEQRKEMNDSIVVPHFSIAGVKQFFTEAGFVDVDVITMKEQSYMEFGGKKLWRTVLIAKGRRPEVESKSEL